MIKAHRTIRRWATMLSGLLLTTTLHVPASSAARQARPLAGSSPHAFLRGTPFQAETKPDAEGLGATTYKNQCSICHGADRKGIDTVFPSLIGVSSRLTDVQIEGIILNGRGRMPAQPTLDAAAVTAVIAYLKTADLAAPPAAPATPPPPPAAISAGVAQGELVYDKNCALCHGEDLLGAPSNYPALIGARSRLGDAAILANIHNGKGRMPAFPGLADKDTAALLLFLGSAPAARKLGK